MEIKKPAMAGTLESSDCQVTVEPGDGKSICAGKRSNEPVWQQDPEGNHGDP